MKIKAGHFLTIRELDADEIGFLIKRAVELKQGWKTGVRPRPLEDKSVAMIFEKTSTRTRVSFEVGVSQFGGTPLFMASQTMQLARSEPLEDTARVLSRYVDAVVIRTFGQDVVEKLAEFGSIPIINALTDKYHPCQVMSDLQTVYEKLGDVKKPVYAWVGDGNNMANSWLEAAGKLQLKLNLACPKGYEPDTEVLENAKAQGAEVMLTTDPTQAAKGANVISTDVWASMGEEDQAEEKHKAFEGFILDSALIAAAEPGCLVMHCLPAHRGEEISNRVIEGPQSVVWDQAENRLHMQKAIMEALLGE